MTEPKPTYESNNDIEILKAALLVKDAYYQQLNAKYHSLLKACKKMFDDLDTGIMPMSDLSDIRRLIE